MSALVLSREAWADGSAHQWLEERRDASGVISLGDNRWAVISHRAAMEVLTDARRFTSRFGTGPHHVAEVAGASLNLKDPPHSTRLRRLLGRLSPPSLDARARQLLDAKPRDFVSDFAQPLALSAFGELFEVHDEAALQQLGALTRALPRAADVQAFTRADAALLEFLRERPTLLVGEDVASALTERDRLYLQRLLAQTGHESTAMAIALSLEVLITRDLPIDASPLAVDELLRFVSPLIRFGRETMSETTLSDVSLPAGARVLVFFPLVNRDPEVFARPNEVLLTRTPNPHLSFGAGPHACFGADIARAVLATALRASAAMPERPRELKSTPLISAVTRGLDSLLLR